MKTAGIFILIVLLMFASFVTGAWIGNTDQLDAKIDSAYSDGYSDGLRNGESGAYASGYADGHREAESHSETYYELLRQAYQSTGGQGAAFSTDAAGNVYVEETAPNGEKVLVPFEP